MNFEIGPTGHLITGSVLDVNRKELERKMQQYDSQLYLKWNPQRQQGQGVWEVRRRPEKKSITKVHYFGGNTYVELDYKENDFENLIWRVETLNYQILDRLKETDVWAQVNYDPEHHSRLTKALRDGDHNREAKEDKGLRDARKEAIYKLNQDKSILRDFQEKINSGVNPALLMAFWGKGSKRR